MGAGAAGRDRHHGRQLRSLAEAPGDPNPRPNPHAELPNGSFKSPVASVSEPRPQRSCALARQARECRSRLVHIRPQLWIGVPPHVEDEPVILYRASALTEPLGGACSLQP